MLDIFDCYDTEVAEGVIYFSFSADALLNFFLKLRREYDSSYASFDYYTDMRIVSSIS